jgi:4-hydroxy-2-oxoheptanedioate aldolase
MAKKEVANQLKEKFRNREKVLGTFIWMGGASTVEALGYTGLDFIIIDNEHGPFDVETTQGMIRTAELSDMTSCVRITNVTRTNVLKQLDAGAEAIIVPDVKHLSEIKDLVRYAKYYPVGERGVAFARKAGYGYADSTQHGLQNYFDTMNRETLLIPQCETKECVELIDDIVAVEGIDGIFIGPYDLSASLGHPGEFEAPAVKEALHKVITAVRNAGKLLMIFTFNKDDIRKYYDMGADAVVYASDVNVMVDAFRRDIKDTLGNTSD